MPPRRGGQSGPLVMYFDTKEIAERLSQHHHQPIPEQKAVFVDFTSQYPSTICRPELGAYTHPIDYVKIPYGKEVTLWGQETMATCDASCLHVCQDDCQRVCDRKKKKHKCDRTCHFVCVTKNKFPRKCGRKDRHTCEEGVQCVAVCNQHHPQADWGKAPSMIQAKVLPPRHVRAPLLRVTITKNGTF